MQKITNWIYTLLFIIVSNNSYSQEVFDKELLIGKWRLDLITQNVAKYEKLTKASYKKTIVFYDDSNFELNILLKDTTITSKGRWEYKNEAFNLILTENINGRIVNQLFLAELTDTKELSLTRIMKKYNFYESYIKE